MKKENFGLFKTKAQALKKAASFRRIERQNKKIKSNRDPFYYTYAVQKAGKVWKIVKTTKRYKKK